MFARAPLPYSGGSLTGAVGWIEGILLGSVGTAIATLSLAAVGLAMLNGHMSYRSGTRAVLGCFVLFGAVQIANVLTDFSRGQPDEAFASPVTPPAAPSLPEAQPSGATNPFDPYAGAAVPQNH
jgi:type IV secretory pathway VirB2 component (pilin)